MIIPQPTVFSLLLGESPLRLFKFFDAEVVIIHNITKNSLDKAKP